MSLRLCSQKPIAWTDMENVTSGTNMFNAHFWVNILIEPILTFSMSAHGVFLHTEIWMAEALSFCFLLFLLLTNVKLIFLAVSARNTCGTYGGSMGTSGSFRATKEKH